MRFKKLTLALCLSGITFWPLSAKGETEEKEVVKKGKYTLTFVNQNPNLNEEVKAGLIKTFFKVYPKMVKDFNKEAITEVTVTIDTAYNGVAYAHNGKITIASQWLDKKPEDLDVITHEGMHLVQAYPGGSGPGWLTEGIADYVRYVYGVDNEGAGWSLPDFDPQHHYKNSYRITARFLLWINQRFDKDFVQRMDEKMRKKEYDESLWSLYTGKTLEELWDQYSIDPKVKI
ncbi:basic secretory protein-like protein [Echinicola salinicaeni]|uniref:basic secretory protein-like protein n=1 Tax=Echinicola salinicaeni TaxID=2762757 RepID=UPI001647C3B2|nr:basic secretory protein-like protein [Echinicola salinicaeni]